MADSKPTPTQLRYLSFIATYIKGLGYAPAETEVVTALKVSSASVNRMIKTLEEKGFIQRKAGIPRSIEVLLPSDLIPQWDEPIFATKPTHARFSAAALTPTERTAKKRPIYRFKITLNHTDPAIWRRIETEDVTLEGLHEVIQTAMGWTNSHLHDFKIGKTRYSHPSVMSDSFRDPDERSCTRVRFSDLLSKHGSAMRLIYEYDFGDCWHHTIKLEKVIEAEPQVKYPRCIAGAQACPPEDVGGVWGFGNYLEAITNPDHEDHEDLLEWGGPFDPDEFNPETATQQMQRGLPSW